jgi:hypothetical protein
MSWDTDKEPIDYLRQRIKYYQKRVARAKNRIKDPYMKEKYGDELPYIIARSILRNESFIAMFKKAVKDLQTIENIENKVENQEPFKQ